MDILLQQLINGVTLGAVYALVALGYTMVYGIIGLINFAHGEVVMIGAMVAFTVITFLAANTELPALIILLIGLLVAAPACMLLAWAMERFAYRPLRGAPRLTPLITAIGLSIVFQNVAMIVWGRNYINFPQMIDKVSYHVGNALITNVQVAILLISAVTMVGLIWLVYRTKLGTAMRATAQDQTVAGLMGVNINQVIAAAFIIGAALAAVAGLMVGTYYEIAHYQMGFMLGLKAFTAAVLGGIGNIAGAMAGGMLLGVIEALGAGYIGDLTGDFLGSHYQDIFAFFVLITVLVFRPSGLLGERVGERA